MACTVSNMRVLTDSRAANATVNARIATAVALPYVHASITAEPFKHVMGLAHMDKVTSWTVSTGLTKALGVWQQNTIEAAALAALRVEMPSMAALAGMSVPVSASAALLDITRIGTAIGAFKRIGEPMRALAEAVELVDRFDRQWQNDALYFIVSGFLTVCDM